MAGMPAKQIGLVDSDVLGFDLMLLIGLLAPYQIVEYNNVRVRNEGNNCERTRHTLHKVEYCAFVL